MRKELKYQISEEKALLLYKMLRCFCQPDEFGTQYEVKSLYYDTYDNKHLLEKLSGVERLGKARIRIYNNDLSLIKLEHKQKKGQYVLKDVKHISKEIYLELLSQKSRINEFFPILERIEPKCVIRYSRKALTYHHQDIRFTFDEQVSISVSKPTLHEDTLFARAFEGVIFEIKYKYELPIHLKKILIDFGIEESISKYALSRTNL